MEDQLTMVAVKQSQMIFSIFIIDVLYVIFRFYQIQVAIAQVGRSTGKTGQSVSSVWRLSEFEVDSKLRSTHFVVYWVVWETGDIQSLQKTELGDQSRVDRIVLEYCRSVCDVHQSVVDLTDNMFDQLIYIYVVIGCDMFMI